METDKAGTSDCCAESGDAYMIRPAARRRGSTYTPASACGESGPPTRPRRRGPSWAAHPSRVFTSLGFLAY